jgi:metacaspase-1
MGNRALLVGINNNLSKPLQGCVNDVEDMATFITQSCGFSMEDVRLLTDARAIKSAIVERLGWLLAGVEVGDRLLFLCSGHGTIFPVRNAQGSLMGMYDAICPSDFDWTPQHTITSVDLDQIFATVPIGVEFVFVSDSCHSGDLTGTTQAPSATSARFLQPPADISWRVKTAQSMGIASTPLSQINCALIAGCQSNQSSYDALFNQRPNGVLTYYLLQTLKGTGALQAPLSQLIALVRAAISATTYNQTPQLRGPGQVIARGFLQD